MLTRREVVIEKPFRDRRYREHRRKVVSARPRIDARPPPDFPHLELKLKKLRLERDRQGKICQDNIKLVHRMAIIMRSKRLDNINMAPRGPFEPRRRSRPPTLPPCPGSEELAEGRGEVRPKSLLEQVTFEAERRIIPPPPGKKIQHRAPAGVCRVPRVGPPPPPPRSPPLPSSRPRTRHHHHHRGLPSSPPSPSRTPIFDILDVDSEVAGGREESPEPSSSAVGDDDGDGGGGDRSEMAGEDVSRLEVEEDIMSRSDKEEGGKLSVSGVEGDDVSRPTGEAGGVSKSTAKVAGGELRRSVKETKEEEEAEESDSDAHVSSVLLTGHPDITISEPSDDEFYT
ncbi:hypothetical protein Pcinc_000093 [Petrolisthes cinctipes]|uniref:Uncharacterized protein n=1 Tax=Petrolisthes cinctipes TaxID=88211 RepID=A0AAE1GQH3_PETCI|nr:hypothetical protein Pcinc_000093 [Petrolisthes cinctipes]